MKYGIDCEFPPASNVAAKARQLGYTFCGVYVGGPRAAAGESWHQVDGTSYPVRDLEPFFPDGFLPLYVGFNAPWDEEAAFTRENGLAHGDDANFNTGACGFDSTSLIVLDVEYDTWAYRNHDAVGAYIAAFVERCNEAGHPVFVYGSEALLDALQSGNDVDGKWGADQIRIRVPNPPAAFWRDYDPASPPPWDIWQCGGGVIAGTEVDFNTATDTVAFAHYAL